MRFAVRVGITNILRAFLQLGVDVEHTQLGTKNLEA